MSSNKQIPSRLSAELGRKHPRQFGIANPFLVFELVSWSVGPAGIKRAAIGPTGAPSMAP